MIIPRLRWASCNRIKTFCATIQIEDRQESKRKQLKEGKLTWKIDEGDRFLTKQRASTRAI